MTTTDAAPRAAVPDESGEPVRWLTVEQQRAWRSYLSGTARLTEALTRQLEQDAGLSLSEYEILVRLSETDGRTLRMSELASSLVHSRSRLTHTVSRLERRGLVRRENCLADGRGVNCVMTDGGYALLVDTAPGHVRAVRANLVDLLTDDQMLALGAAMARIAEGPADPDEG
ncbi:MarR family transcriptional regulator [Actinotalea ferrariae]|uniref:MarR family winged helix-turn-helix transcriptional regulator n=1 Tax=Actinotalea ferrariae TaxID=1386098 RepID=UPI001C8BE3F6|nr:MarR family transcriptional regulator [Actinotalea ferrariae]MBX9244622.1 MarR family transcriptional regulator [Actinotalea ferrariae]